MEQDERVVLLGEDISDPGGGVFGVTRGLSTRFGDRVRDTPISDRRSSVPLRGRRLAGLRPVAEIMFMDFLAVCLDQLVNHAAKIRYMSGGRTPVPSSSGRPWAAVSVSEPSTPRCSKLGSSTHRA